MAILKTYLIYFPVALPFFLSLIFSNGQLKSHLVTEPIVMSASWSQPFANAANSVKKTPRKYQELIILQNQTT